MAELDSQPKSIQSLYAWYAEKQLWVNRRYQRKLVWTLEEKQQLVESVLQRYPIPAILLAEREGGGYEVIDGLQRIHTLMSFIEARFPTADGRHFPVVEFITAKTRAAEGVFEVDDAQPVLTSREAGTLLDYPFAVSVMRGASTAEIDEVFRRINTYGHRLSDQERRQAGVQNEFSGLVRELACAIREDVSRDELELADMPSISIDLPKSRHGYDVQAKDVFWVRHGILRSTDLRDSMDEQCIADIAACVVGGSLVPRSKDALDAIYESSSSESTRIAGALLSYGGDKFSAEFKYVIDEIEASIAAGPGSLRDLLFKARTTNPFQALFAVLFVAFHETLIGEGRKIADYAAARKALEDLNARVDTSRGSTSATERRQNINQIKGLITPHTVESAHKDVYGDYSTFDIDEALRRSEVETPHYELKQGVLRLDGTNSIDPSILDKIIRTICAIANNGRGRAGTIYLGVADREQDAKRVQELHGIEPHPVGRKYVVGVQRETAALGESTEAYVARVRDAIAASGLSEPLKSAVLASLSYSDYRGLGVLIIRVPEQDDVSNVGEHVYVRAGDQTMEVSGLDLINVAKRFR